MITLTILVLHVVSANPLIPKFIVNRLSIGPVAATVGILFWGRLWGVMGLLLAVPLTTFIKLVADLHPSFSAQFAPETGQIARACRGAVRGSDLESVEQ